MHTNICALMHHRDTRVAISIVKLIWQPGMTRSRMSISLIVGHHDVCSTYNIYECNTKVYVSCEH